VPLPPGFRLRPAVPADAEPVAALCNAETFAALGITDTTADELRSDWTQPHEAAGPREAVVEDTAGTIVGYLSVHVDPVEHEAFGFLVATLEPPPGLPAAMLEELEQRAAWWHRRAGVEGTVRIGTLDAPGVWPDALAAAGYRQTRRLLLMRRPLDEAPEPPQWPDGIALVPFDRAADARAVHAALTEAFADDFGPPYEPFEQWSHGLFEQPAMEYRDDLVLVARAGDEVAGVLLAAARASESPEAGYVAELGVRRPWRRRGLGRALLLEAFSRLRAAGRAEAVLHVDAQSLTGATSVYRAAGMREERMYANWQRPKPGAAG
jgi:mycothiol synthase